MYHHLKQLSWIFIIFLSSLSSSLLVTPLQQTVVAKAETTQTTPNDAVQLFQTGTQQLENNLFRDALETFYQTLAAFRETEDSHWEAATLNNLGRIYDRLGNYEEALQYYQQALAILQEIGNPADMGVTLNNIGVVYDNLQNYNQALDYYQQALVIFQDIENHEKVGKILNNIGIVYDNFQNYQQGLKYYQQALVIFEKIDNQEGAAEILNNIGIIYTKLAQYDKALEYYQQALKIRRQIGDKIAEGSTLRYIAEVYKRIKQYSNAEKNLFSAIEILESLRQNLTDEQKIFLLDSQADVYQTLQQILIAQNQTNTALEVAERGRARAFVELLENKLLEQPNNQGTINPPNIQQIKKIAAQQNATIVQYSIIQNFLNIQGKQKKVDSELYIWVIQPTGNIIFRSISLKKLWQQQHTSLQELVFASRCFSNDICRREINLASSKHNLISLITRGKSPFNSKARDLQIIATPNPKSPNQELRQLHQILIEPIADLLSLHPNQKIIFIPQRELFFVPFPALQDATGNYLIEKHPILTAPAIEVLASTYQRKQQIKTKVKFNNFLIVGNPIMPQIPTENTKNLEQLTPLPNAEIEAEAIAKIFNTQPLIGNQATESNVVKKMLDAQIIHLATHGKFNKSHGLKSWIALTPSQQDDGFLTAEQIIDLNLQAELVVLSACDTGLGEITEDGVIGLSRSFIGAGVPSIIVSLWTIPDRQTADLMREFYQSFQHNSDKAEALQQAMLKTMQKYPDPYYWAAFTLIGESQ